MNGVKKLTVFMADSSLDFTRIVGGQHNNIEMNLSSSINLCVQFAQLSAQQQLPLTTNQLLFCCDILNGGAHLTEFVTPDSVSIESALGSMIFSLKDAISQNYGGEIEKWEIKDRDEFFNAIRLIQKNISLMWTLAIATRQFWCNEPIGNRKSLKECEGYKEWAKQWVNN